jgi:hypothetical protein
MIRPDGQDFGEAKPGRSLFIESKGAATAAPWSFLGTLNIKRLPEEELFCNNNNRICVIRGGTEYFSTCKRSIVMMKKINFCLSAFMICLSISWYTPVSQAAAPIDAHVSFPVFPATVNGTVMDVSHSEYPLLVYKDITYFPMTWNNTSALGLTVSWNAGDGLSLQKNDACVPLQQNLTPLANSNENGQTAGLAPFPVQVGGKQVVNAEEPYPVLFYRNITYFPMTWRFAHDEFGWNTSWDAEHGFGISSCAGLSDTQKKQADDLNVANSGQVAVQGDWIYMNPASKYEGPNQLVKVKKDGSGEIRLSDDNAKSINIAGNWLYYTVSEPSTNRLADIYKIKTDGTERTQVSAVPTTQIWLQDDWIYYIRQTFEQRPDNTGGGYFTPSGLYKMKTDGSSDSMLVQGKGINHFFLNGDRIYFLMQDNEAEPSRLFRLNLDGSEVTKLQDSVTKVFVIDGWVYYINNFGKQLNKMSPDGFINIPVVTSDQWIATLSYRQGWLYMVNGSFGIQGTAFIDKLKIDGTGRTHLAQARASALYFADRTLYFPQFGMGDNHLEHMEVD